MRHTTGVLGWAVAVALITMAAVAVAGLVGGCGPEQKLPDRSALPTEPDKPDAPPVPKTSHPEAVKVVDRAVRAVTGGHPERIDKTRVNELVLKGVVEWRVPEQVLTVGAQATRRLTGVWPDRLGFVQDVTVGNVRVSMGRRPAGFWFLVGRGAEKPEPPQNQDPREEEDILRVDATGGYWMLMLTPLTDPATVVYDARKVPVEGVSFDLIKAAVPGCPVFTLWFEEKSGLLGRVEYTHTERRSEIHKVHVLTEPKQYEGLTLPSGIKVLRNTKQVEDWKVESWKFPDKIEDTAFDPPR